MERRKLPFCISQRLHEKWKNLGKLREKDVKLFEKSEILMKKKLNFNEKKVKF